MILVDASIWVRHLRAGDYVLAHLLDAGSVVTHQFVIGELALGNLQRRDAFLSEMHDLPQALVATDDEILHFIGRHALFGLGIGYVDVHLLAAVQLSGALRLWTSDKRLDSAASRLGVAFRLDH